VFEDENIILIENSDDVLDRINNSGPLVRTSENQDKFKHLLDNNTQEPGNPDDKRTKTRFMTSARQT